MATFVEMLPMIAAQLSGPQRLERTLEREQITDASANVVQYDRVMGTKLAVAYWVGLEIAHRAGPACDGGAALDLACGPGHYTLCLARFLAFDRVIGVDLSAPMIDVATRNAAEQGLAKRLAFRVGDITNLEGIESGQFDLAGFNTAAHHMPDLGTVTNVLREMDRVTKPDGLVMVMDLVRLRTRALTERYVKTLGQDYVERGLPAFLDDFRNSMYAAWTAKELRQAIPRDTARYWCHIVPRGLPTIQVILGLPVGQKRPFVRSGVPWGPDETPVPPDLRSEWRLLRMSLRFASRHWVPPAA